MLKMRLHLMRHGQVVGFEARRYNGQADVPLTALGIGQTHGYAARVMSVPLTAVYSSDLCRSAFGANLIGTQHHLNPVQDPRLRELHIGDWEGLTWDEIQLRWPLEWQARLNDLVNIAPPGGENLQQMADRVRLVVAELLAKHPGEEIALVAHGGVNRVILLDAIGAPLTQMFHLEQSYGCYNIIDFFADGYTTVQLLNAAETET
ncbi:alpha-ribazole phosphatase [Geopsychrobacter electrodiphilus]|uniref:alpha-ribazole phosphatase n=1 Tax=Geopsychrobacter electrodiphilus TaxID=225196 RepID=UPI000369C5E8|nr:alpha-ribazole phosphatase [Geopsychrobacter electrodiphilus]